MPDIGPDNLHTELFPYAKVVYWKDGVAVGKLNEWTEATISAKQFNSPEIRIQRAHKDKLDRMLSMMQFAYDSGMRAKAKQVREVLMIPETR